jgi:hypothetical protein
LAGTVSQETVPAFFGLILKGWRMDALLKYWPVLNIIFIGVGVWVLWSLRATFVSREDLEATQKEIDGRINETKERMIRVEARLETVPTQDEINALTRQVSELRGDVSGIRAKMDGVADLVKQLQRQTNIIVEAHLPREGAS